MILDVHKSIKSACDEINGKIVFNYRTHRYFILKKGGFHSHVDLLNRCTLSPLDEEDLFVRAKKVLTVAEQIGCRKYLTPHELVKVLVNRNSKKER